MKDGARRMPEMVPEVCSCAALRQAARHVTKLYDDALAPAGLGLNQYAILAKLERIGPQTLGDMAGLLVMDRSTLGHLLRPLEKRGLVRLDLTAEDRRRRSIVLTPAGKSLVLKARPLWAKAEHRFERAFGAVAARGLRTVLKQVATIDFNRTAVAGAV
jgi:DNA-binding MarR family transcriptional regulator